MREKCSCRRESMRLNRNARDLRALHLVHDACRMGHFWSLCIFWGLGTSMRGGSAQAPKQNKGKDLFPYLKVPLDVRGLGWR